MKKLIHALVGLALLSLGTLAIAQQTSPQEYPISNNQPAIKRYFGSGANDNDVLFTATGTSVFDACMLMSTTGVVDVEVTIDGSNWGTTTLSLQDFGASTSDPVKVTVALRMYAVNGKYLGIRVLQNGATAAAASMLCWKR